MRDGYIREINFALVCGERERRIHGHARGGYIGVIEYSWVSAGFAAATGNKRIGIDAFFFFSF